MPTEIPSALSYVGRLAPTPTGYLHAGHAATFRTAYERAAGGRLFLRFEDLDTRRCKPEFVASAIEDLAWLGIRWTGEAVFQSSRREYYLEAWRKLRAGGHLYPCRRSRKDVQNAVRAPHHEEPIFPIEWRTDDSQDYSSPDGLNWRFRVPQGVRVRFLDGRCGPVERVGQSDFGDFIVWNRDNIPAYELAVVVDDLAMEITEVVRGCDLLTSTARQLLLIQALGGQPPSYFHCPLVVDANGHRLSKRDGGSEIRTLRKSGRTPEEVWGL